MIETLTIPKLKFMVSTKMSMSDSLWRWCDLFIEIPFVELRERVFVNEKEFTNLHGQDSHGLPLTDVSLMFPPRAGDPRA